MNIAQPGQPILISRELTDGKFVETTQTVTTLDENAILNRKIQIQSRQAQIRQQIEMLKADYDSLSAAIVDCDDMLSQFAPVTNME